MNGGWNTMITKSIKNYIATDNSKEIRKKKLSMVIKWPKIFSKSATMLSQIIKMKTNSKLQA